MANGAILNQSTPLPTPEEIGAVGWSQAVIGDGDILAWAEERSSPTYIGVGPSVTNMPFDGAYWVVEFKVTSSGNWKLLTATRIINGVGTAQKYENGFINGFWNGWTEVATANKFLPLTGGTLTGGTVWLYNGYGRILSDETVLRLCALNSPKDTNNRRSLLIHPATNTDNPGITHALRLFDVVNGVSTGYDIYGTHNIIANQTDYTAGSTALATGAIHLRYE